ncbi:MAG: hypothetical protein ACYCYA_08940, partial [Actinomycetes bacterium]
TGAPPLPGAGWWEATTGPRISSSAAVRRPPQPARSTSTSGRGGGHVRQTNLVQHALAASHRYLVDEAVPYDECGTALHLHSPAV